jgi:hypothetical protein
MTACVECPLIGTAWRRVLERFTNEQSFDARHRSHGGRERRDNRAIGFDSFDEAWLQVHLSVNVLSHVRARSEFAGERPFQRGHDVSGIDSSGRHPFSHRSFRHRRHAVIGGQRDRVVARTGASTSRRGPRTPAKRTVQPNQHVLNLVAVGTEIVTDFVERREADPQQICRSHGIEPKARRDVARPSGARMASVAKATIKK